MSHIELRIRLIALVPIAGAALFAQEPLRLPATVEVCETVPVLRLERPIFGRSGYQMVDTKICGSWTSTKTGYDGHWADRTIGQLIVDRFDQGGIQIRRLERGFGSGGSAVYTGHFGGVESMSGKVVRTAMGRTVEGTWQATFSRLEPVSCLDGNRPPGDAARALDIARASARSGDNAAAAACLLWAAREGNAEAQIDTAYAYENGSGVALNAEESVSWFKKAAEQENIGAQLRLAEVLSKRLGVQQDDSAAEWWRGRALSNLARQSAVCASLPAMSAMSRIELRSLADPVNAGLAIFAGRISGADFSDARPQLVYSHAQVDSPAVVGKFHFASGTPNGVLCESWFLRGHLKFAVEDDAGFDKQVMGEMGRELTRKYPAFREYFRLTTLDGSRYCMVLEPQLFSLARVYSETVEIR